MKKNMSELHLLKFLLRISVTVRCTANHHNLCDSLFVYNKSTASGHQDVVQVARFVVHQNHNKLT